MASIFDYERIDSGLAELESEEKKEKVKSAANLTIDVDPDQHAKNLSIFDKTGLEGDTAERIGEQIIDMKTAQDREIQAVFNTPPEAHDWLSDPDNAKLVSDDFSLIARTAKTMNNVGLRGRAGTVRVREGALGTLEGQADFMLSFTGEREAFDELGLQGVPTPWETIGDIFGLMRQGARAEAEELRRRSPAGSSIEEGIYAGIESLTGQLPATLLSVATGNPIPALMTAGVTTGGTSFGEAKDAGLSPAEAARFGATDAAIEVATELLPVARLIGDTKAGSSFMKTLTRQMATEIPGELTATTLQNFNRWATLNPDQPFSSYLDSLPDDLAMTFIATLTSVGLQTGAVYSGDRLIRRPAPPSVPAELVKGINDEAKENKLLQRSPNRFRDLINQLAGDERIYFNAEALQNMMGQAPRADVNALLNQVPDLRIELENAVATGADIAISKADYATYIAPLEGSDVLAEYAKLDPADVSVAEVREQQAFAEDNPELVAEFEDTVNIPEIPEDSYAAIERIVGRAMRDAGRSSEESKAVSPLFARTIARFAQPFGIQPVNQLNTGLLEFVSVNEDGKTLREGSNFKSVLTDLKKLREGKKPRGMDDVARQAAENFGARLDDAGISIQEADALSSQELFDRLSPAPQEAAESVLSQTAAEFVSDENLTPVSEVGQDDSVLGKSYLFDAGDTTVQASIRETESDIFLNIIASKKTSDLSETQKGSGEGRRVIEALKNYADQTGKKLIIPDTTDSARSFWDGIEWLSPDDSVVVDFDGELYAPPNTYSYSPNNTLFQKAPATDSPEFRAWFGDSQVVDEDGAPAIVYHGTTHDISAFNFEKANPESDMGAGIYFSNTPGDVAENYAGVGPDLTQRIEQRVDRLSQDIEDQFDEKGREAVLQSLYRSLGDLRFVSDDVASMDDTDAARAAAEVIARRELDGGAPNTVPAYLSFQNPAIIQRNGGSYLDGVVYNTEDYIAQAQEELQEEYEPDEIDEDLIRERAEALAYENEDIEEGGVSGLLDAIEFVSQNYDGVDMARVREEAEMYMLEGGYLGQILDTLKQSEGLAYAEDENGTLVNHEIIRQALEQIGFDGIIDYTVDEKFGSQRRMGQSMAGMNEETVHYIAFTPEQIKSPFNEGQFDPNNPNILNQQERGSITFSRDLQDNLRRVTIAFTERANFSTAAHEFSHFGVALHRDFAARAMDMMERGDVSDDVRRIADDWEKLKKAVGARDDTFTVEQEEKVASMFEAYIREGKAPSEGLRSVFARFREWLTRIYSDIRQLGVDLDPEVAGVFDRWLATDAEIELVNEKNDLLAQVAEEMGLDPAIKNQVADYINSSKVEAGSKVFRELSREQRKRETKAYQNELAAMRNVVSDEFSQIKEYALIDYLEKTGARIFIDPNANQSALGIPPESDALPAGAYGEVTPEELDRLAAEEGESVALREAVIDTLLSPDPKRPQTLTSFLVSRGGLTSRETVTSEDMLGARQDSFQSGDLKAMGITAKARPGIINNKSGMTLDMAREAAAEAGFIPVDSDINDFLEALRADFNGQELFADSAAGAEYLERVKQRDDADRIANEMGIDLAFERERRKKFGRYSGLFTDDASSINATAADEVAEIFGYETGRELVKALRQTSDFNRVVDKEARRRLLDKYPDMIQSGRIKVEAVDSVMNDRVLIALDLMIKELGKMANGRAVGMKQFARVMAQRNVAQMKAKDSGYAYRYDAARDREIRNALKESRKGNADQALIHLQRAMINQMTYKSLREFNGLKEKANALFKKVNAKDRDLAQSRDIDFVGAARFVLFKYGLGGEYFDVNAWMADIQERDPDIMADLVGMSGMISAPQKESGDLTVADFTEIYNSVQNIFHAARQSKQFQLDDRKIKTEEAVGEMVEILGKHKERPELEGTQLKGKAKIRERLMGAKAMQRRVEHWTNSVQGGFDGAIRDYVFQPISDASSAYRDARSKWMEGLNEIFTKHKARLSEREKINVPEIGMKFGDRMELIGFMLHTGNESNLEKLLGGYGIARDSWFAARDRLQSEGIITKADYQIVQELWDYAEALKPLSQKAHKDLYGYRFDEIESTPLMTPYGTFRGGYWPATVDYDQVKDKLDVKGLDDLKRFSLASTNKGFTKSRSAAYQKPLSTDLKIAAMHVDQVLKFAYMEPTVRKVSRLINNHDFKDALERIDSEAKISMLDPWLQRSAWQTVTAMNTGNDWVSRNVVNGSVWRQLNKVVSRNMMIGNIPNAIQNYTALPMALHKVGARRMAKSFAQYIKNPFSTAEEIQALSSYMRNRQNVNDILVTQHINDIAMRKTAIGKFYQNVDKYGYVFQRVTQNHVDNLTWVSAYNQALEEGRSEADSVKYADSVVRTTMSSLNPEDVSAIEAGPEIVKFFTKFYSFFNNIANYQQTEASNIIREAGWKGAPQLFYLYLLAVLAPAVLGDLVVKALRGSAPDDDDNDGEVLDDWLSFVMISQARFLLAEVPIVGQAGNLLIGQLTEEQFDDRISVNPSLGLMETSARFAGKVAGDGYDDDSNAVRDGMRAIGFMTGLPLGQLSKPASFLADVEEGDSRPENAAEFARGLVGGPTPK